MKITKQIPLLPLPPKPDQVPVLYVERGQKQVPVKDLAELNLPEGYEGIRCKGGGWVKPLDRLGNLRKMGEQWWESTWMDGEIVPVIGVYKSRGARYNKPEGWETRKLCSARAEGEWCRYPRGQCPLGHCEGWGVTYGRGCSKPQVLGKKVCKAHSGAPGKLPKTAKGIYEKHMRSPALIAIHKEVKALAAGTSVVQELELLRSFATDALRRAEEMGDSDALWLELKDTWNGLAKSKNERDVDKTLAQVGRLIQNGVDVAVARRHVIDINREVVNTAKVQGALDADKSRAMTADQALTFVAAVMSAVTSIWASDTQRLRQFKTQMSALMQDGANLTPMLTDDSGNANVDFS